MTNQRIIELHEGIAKDLHEDISELSEENERLRAVVIECQDILARYIVPDSHISDHDCINQLLGILDGSMARKALDRTK